MPTWGVKMSEIFETKNVDLAEHMLSTTYSSMRIHAQGQRQGFRMTRTALGPVLLEDAEVHVAVIDPALPSQVADGEPTIEDRHDAHPDTLRRAVAFIDEHAHRDITVADIAAAAFVTIRAIQLAFRRHLDTTPLEYLRRVRLDHAHHALIAADAEYETVTAVAYRWGFSSPSRFAARYRATYGLLPGDTLRQR